MKVSVAVAICSGTEQDNFEVCADFECTCGCSKADGRPYSTLCNIGHFIDHHAQASLPGIRSRFAWINND